jgi:sialidase-1
MPFSSSILRHKDFHSFRLNKLFTFCFLLFSIGSIKSQTDLEFISLFKSENQAEVSCYRIPSIITAVNGDVIAVIDERVPSCRDLKWSDDINIVMRRSKDNGLTWTDIETVVDYPFGQSASDPSLILDSTTGTIFLFFNYMDLINEKDIYYFKMIKSEDNGLTWSVPEDITSQIAKPEWANDFKFITSGRGIQLSSGTLIHTMVNIQNGSHLFKSENHGESWELIDFPLRPGDESKIVELSDSSWMVNSRVNKMRARYVHISQDEGNTWNSHPDNQLIDPACNASIIKYDIADDGSQQTILFFANASSMENRENLSIKYSLNNGQTWSEGKTIYPGKSAYSEMTILKNGDIGLFFEKDGYEENVFVSLTVAWITNGMIK